jgi:hypothetical protein
MALTPIRAARARADVMTGGRAAAMGVSWCLTDIALATAACLLLEGDSPVISPGGAFGARVPYRLGHA